MSARLSETFFDAFRQVRLSYDRVLDRLSRCAVSIMNLTVRLLQLFCVTLLYFSAVKSAYIPRESDGDTHVVPFTDVYNKSMCRPREMLVDVQQEYPEDIEHIFIPSCVVLMRCAGCCNDEMLECTPTATHNITMEVQKLKPMRIRRNYPMSFTEHTECECRIKKNIIQEKTENTHCKPCCSTCSERRKRLFVQDPETCQCSCKHTEADCKLKQLELNERTCRCDKPRR
ncbi:vascular endothelial growth factor Ab isoform X4 [Trichomycterus rosablanca]|uniref:vascular endothelial growth factor Ab isoform X4 n=1 Tax=Trichomycterus rosablanca TaxID=2290929 RepID=UPI002F35C921